VIVVAVSNYRDSNTKTNITAMMTLDEASEVAKKIFDDAKDNMNKIVSEEDAKIQIITHIM
jgi:hypothetical protein